MAFEVTSYAILTCCIAIFFIAKLFSEFQNKNLDSINSESSFIGFAL